MNTARHNEFDWQAFLYVADEMSPDERDRFEALLATEPAACEAVARAVGLIGGVVQAFDGGRSDREYAESTAPVVSPSFNKQPIARRAVPGKPDSTAFGSNARNRKALAVLAGCLLAALSLWFAGLGTTTGDGPSQIAQSAGNRKANPGSFRENALAGFTSSDLIAVWAETGQTVSAAPAGTSLEPGQADSLEFLPLPVDSNRFSAFSSDEAERLLLDSSRHELSAAEAFPADQAEDADFTVPSWLLAAVSVDRRPAADSMDDDRPQEQ